MAAAVLSAGIGRLLATRCLRKPLRCAPINHVDIVVAPIVDQQDALVRLLFTVKAK
jgi:hypothetical protein